MPQETSSELDPDDSDAELFVEVDPTGRYGRYKEILGKGAFKKVYRAFDEWEGIEVAWNQVKVSEIVRSSDDLERLYSEVNLLKTLKHKNIIKFYNSWVDTIHEHINFITEIFTSGTLRQYRKKHKRVDLRALKKWSRQILEGLHYLHVNDPPIIHRDLKCDNIFVNGNHGEVKIGDLGFAAILRHANAAHSVIGTPEFMAPELYEEEYNELVDIYAFGMCMLELVTFEYPYSECSNAAQIYKKVTSGIKPASLAKVSEPSVKVFIEKCIADVSDRMSARELLRDPFLSSDRDQEGSNHSLHIVHLPLDVVPVQSNRDPRSRVSQPEALEQRRDYRMLSERKDLNTIFIKLKITDSAGQNRNIHFPFDLEADTSIAVASEMVHELDLTDQDVTTVADMIDSEIRSHIPDWSPRESSVDESLLDSYTSDSRYTASPITNASAYSSASLVLGQLSSGRKVWSNSPKAAGGNSSLKLHPFSASHFEVCVVEESNQNSSSTVDVHDNEDACSHEFPNNTTANGQHLGGPEDQLNEVVLQSNPQVSFDKHSVVDPKERGIEIVSKSRFTVDDVYLNNEAEDDQKDVLIDTRNKTVNSGEDVGMYEGNASEVRTFVEKLEQLLVEQQREMDMLKVKHGMIVLNLLNELSPQIRDEVFELCKHRIPCHEISASQMTNLVRNDTEAGSSIISLAKSPTDIDLAISVKAIQLSKVKEPATGADRLVIGPIFRDRLNSLKRNNNSDAGIAVILRDESEKSG